MLCKYPDAHAALFWAAVINGLLAPPLLSFTSRFLEKEEESKEEHWCRD